MQHQTAPRPHGVPEEFYRNFGRHVTAVLSGFDRMRFRGTLRMLFNPAKMDLYLDCCGVLLKDFGSFAEQWTAKVKGAARAAAQRLSRPIEYLNSPAISKEELARQIAQRDHLRSGLIALFMALEPCLSYAIRKDRARQQIKSSQHNNNSADSSTERRSRNQSIVLVLVVVLESAGKIWCRTELSSHRQRR